MALRRYSLQATAPIALSSSQTKTVLLLAAGAPTCELHEVSCSFDGVLATATKARLELFRYTTGGTMTSLTPVKLDSSSGACVATGFHTATAEPTTGDLLFAELVHLQSGYTWRVSGLGIRLNNGEYVGLRIVNGSTATNCLPRMIFEE